MFQKCLEITGFRVGLMRSMTPLGITTQSTISRTHVRKKTTRDGPECPRHTCELTSCCNSGRLTDHSFLTKTCARMCEFVHVRTHTHMHTETSTVQVLSWEQELGKNDKCESSHHLHANIQLSHSSKVRTATM